MASSAADAPSSPISVCGIDPGIVNMSFWIGSYDPQTDLVATAVLDKRSIGGALEKKQSVQAATAQSAMEIADACAARGIAHAVVETAPQWNVPIRISAATLYGVLRGRGIGGVRFSSPTTKAGAVRRFAERMGMVAALERPPDGVDKLDKRASAKIRLINKRNAVAVVDALLKRSGDEVGSRAFASDPGKQDDMADALLLGCGLAMALQKEQVVAATRIARAEKKKKKRKKDDDDDGRAKAARGAPAAPRF
jgi:hypothetical protein